MFTLGPTQTQLRLDSQFSESNGLVSGLLSVIDKPKAKYLIYASTKINWNSTTNQENMLKKYGARENNLYGMDFVLRDLV